MSEAMKPFVALAFPAWLRWGVRRGAILEQPEGRGANGRRLCRWCASEVPKGSQSWCSRRCVDQFRRVWSWGALSQYVIDRDDSCQRCGCEHPGWNRARSLLRCHYHWAHYSRDRFRAEFFVLAPWWEVDHILPVLDGGTDDPANLRLLCHACHVAAGIEQRRARKAQLQIEGVA